MYYIIHSEGREGKAKYDDHIREGLTRKKKKCELSHFWSGPPPPKKCEM